MSCSGSRFRTDSVGAATGQSRSGMAGLGPIWSAAGRRTAHQGVRARLHPTFHCGCADSNHARVWRETERSWLDPGLDAGHGHGGMVVPEDVATDRYALR